MQEKPDNIFVITARLDTEGGEYIPHLLKYHFGNNYRYARSEYSDVRKNDTFRKKYHAAELEDAIRNVLPGKLGVAFNELLLTDSELAQISSALKEKIDKDEYVYTYPIYVQRKWTKPKSSFPAEMLHTHFTRVW